VHRQRDNRVVDFTDARLSLAADLLQSRSGVPVHRMMARVALLVASAMGSDSLPDFDMSFAVDGADGIVNTGELRAVTGS
jgi:hypothetical protein